MQLPFSPESVFSAGREDPPQRGHPFDLVRHVSLFTAGVHCGRFMAGLSAMAVLIANLITLVPGRLAAKIAACVHPVIESFIWDVQKLVSLKLMVNHSQRITRCSSRLKCQFIPMIQRSK